MKSEEILRINKLLTLENCIELIRATAKADDLRSPNNHHFGDNHRLKTFYADMLSNKHPEYEQLLMAKLWNYARTDAEKMRALAKMTQTNNKTNVICDVNNIIHSMLRMGKPSEVHSESDASSSLEISTTTNYPSTSSSLSSSSTAEVNSVSSVSQAAPVIEYKQLIREIEAILNKSESREEQVAKLSEIFAGQKTVDIHKYLIFELNASIEAHIIQAILSDAIKKALLLPKSQLRHLTVSAPVAGSASTLSSVFFDLSSSPLTHLRILGGELIQDASEWKKLSKSIYQLNLESLELSAVNTSYPLYDRENKLQASFIKVLHAIIDTRIASFSFTPGYFVTQQHQQDIIDKMAEMLPYASSLKHFSFNPGRCYENTDAVYSKKLVELVNACKNHRGLTSLKLSGAIMDDTSISAIVKLISENKKITSLDLSNNNMTSAHMNQIILALAHSQRLTQVNLSGNQFDETCAQSLLRVLKRNPCIVSVVLPDTRLFKEASIAITQQLESNARTTQASPRYSTQTCLPIFGKLSQASSSSKPSSLPSNATLDYRTF